MAVKSRASNNIAKSASKLHKHVLSLLVEMFPNYTVKQECRVSEINPLFKSNRERYDLIVEELRVVIEAHGIQHFEMAHFGGITNDEAKKNLIKRQEVDYLKEKAARDAGWAYVVVKYNEKNINANTLLDRIQSAIEDIKEDIEIIKKPKVKINSNNKFSNAPKRKIQSRGFQKPKDGYKWPKKKIK